MFDIHFYGTSYSDEVAYTWYWNNELGSLQGAVSVNHRLVRLDD